jgi:hypothetical protein
MVIVCPLFLVIGAIYKRIKGKYPSWIVIKNEEKTETVIKKMSIRDL